jgi:hypothetical protein
MDALTNAFTSMSMEEDDTDVYSSPYDNYLRVVHTIETLESGIRLTEDWFEEHKKHILKYREVFPNFQTINEYVEDTEFRRKAYETETLLSNLVQEIHVRGVFTPRMYLLLNKRLKELCELIWNENELLDMFSGMRM